MTKPSFDEFPYNFIYEEEQQVLPSFVRKIGLDKYLSLQSTILSIFDQEYVQARERKYRTTISRSGINRISYIMLVMLFGAGVVFIVKDSYEKGGDAGEYIFGGFVFLFVCLGVFKSLEKGMRIVLLPDRVIVNGKEEFLKKDIKDVLIIKRPTDDVETMFLIFIHQNNTYDRFDITELERKDVAYSIRTWLLNEEPESITHHG